MRKWVDEALRTFFASAIFQTLSKRDLIFPASTISAVLFMSFELGVAE